MCDMRLLVLGGTQFVGRAIVDEALGRGHDVTTFTRGRGGRPRPGAEALHGDRTRPGDLLQLAGRDWDAVIDTSVLAPAHVAEGARLLADRAGHYTYVSTVGVYRDHPRAPVTEDSPTRACPPDAAGTVETLGYGELKAGTERAIAAEFPGRYLIVRPGPIAGPHDDVGCLPWWLARIARGGRVLAPGKPGQPVRLTDARDLAAWILDNTRRRIPGIVNVPGPDGHTLGEFLGICMDVTGTGTGAAASLVWADDAVLLAAGVQPCDELPFWTPDVPDLAGTWQVSGERALLTGIRYRPLADTVRDTWRWLLQSAGGLGGPSPQAGTAGSLANGGTESLVTSFERRPGTGLDPAREREILASL